jgi:hypothetical protein
VVALTFFALLHLRPAFATSDEATAWATAFFYTLSTIAQALASSFGVLAVFVFFRLESIDERISHLGLAILERAFPDSRPPHLIASHIEGEWHEFVNTLDSACAQKTEPIMRGWLARIKDDAQRREELRKRIGETARWTFDAVVISIMLLPFAHLMGRHLWLGLPVCFGAVALAFRALSGCRRLLSMSLGRSVFVYAAGGVSFGAAAMAAVGSVGTTTGAPAGVPTTSKPT